MSCVNVHHKPIITFGSLCTLMMMILTNQDFYFYLVFSFWSYIIEHFLYMVSWEVKLHLSTMVTFPPKVSEILKNNTCVFQMFAIGDIIRVYAHENA